MIALLSKLIATASLCLIAITGLAMPAPATAATAPTLTRGFDIASFAGRPTAAQWAAYASQYKFVFIKATEGTYYTSPNFSSQYAGATAAHMLRGAYHFANPRDTRGALQADYFIAHGGGWTPDGKTLPGVLDIEYDPYTSNMCYGLSQSAMVAWITAFNNEYLAKEGVYPIIYSTVGWWSQCTGNTSAFSKSNVFWLASITGSSTSGPSSLPAGVGNWTFWQYGQQSNIDLNQFHGSLAQLQAYATRPIPLGCQFPPGTTTGLGTPIQPAVTVNAFGSGGCYQSFTGGRGVITSRYGTFQTSGAIYSSWTPATHGWPSGALTSVTASGVTGFQQNYTAGSNVVRAYWTAQHPTTAWLTGPLLTQYESLGGTPVVGWPTSAVVSATAFGVTGSFVRLQNGQTLVTSKYGTFVLEPAAASTWQLRSSGWPTANAQGVSASSGLGVAGMQQTFVGPTSGARVFWTQANPGVVWLSGNLLTQYDAMGGTASVGWPVTPVSTRTAFGVVGSTVKLQNGQGLITSKYGTFPTNAGIYASWSPTRLGWPTGAPFAVTARGVSGYQQNFAEVGTSANVRAFWNPATPSTALWLSGPFLTHYDAIGGTSVVGWPVSAVTSQTAFGVVGWTQRFQGGRGFIGSSYGVFDSSGTILANWRPASYGWPITSLQRTVLHGQSGWLQRFRKGTTGVDYAFVSAATGRIVWTNGTP